MVSRLRGLGKTQDRKCIHIKEKLCFGRFELDIWQPLNIKAHGGLIKRKTFFFSFSLKNIGRGFGKDTFFLTIF